MELNSPSRRIGFDRFGLPSSTAQSVIFSLVYIYFSLKNTKITFAYFIIAFLSIVQKIIYNNNTIIQIVAGVFVGTLLAYSFYEYAKHILKRELKEKLEDDGPV
jgi:phosphate/sulfate permease